MWDLDQKADGGTNRESMSYVDTELNSNPYCHYKVNDRDSIELDVQKCHYALQNYNIVRQMGKCEWKIKEVC